MIHLSTNNDSNSKIDAYGLGATISRIAYLFRPGGPVSGFLGSGADPGWRYPTNPHHSPSGDRLEMFLKALSDLALDPGRTRLTILPRPQSEYQLAMAQSIVLNFLTNSEHLPSRALLVLAQDAA